MFTLSEITTSIASSDRCQKTTNRISKRIPRPQNSFMIFRQEKQEEIRLQRNGLPQQHTSKIIGQWWKGLSPEEKQVYTDKAKKIKLEHERKYPAYKFSPQRKIKKVKRNGVARGRRKIRRSTQRGYDLTCATGKEFSTTVRSDGTNEAIRRELLLLQPFTPDVYFPTVAEPIFSPVSLGHIYNPFDPFQYLAPSQSVGQNANSQSCTETALSD